MAGHFEATGDGGAAIALDEVEISILRSLAVQLLELIGPGEEPADGDDPLSAIFTDGPERAALGPGAGPALPRRLRRRSGRRAPDAESEDERRASAEFRRFTENDLRARKREDGLAVVRGLDSLTPDPAGAHGSGAVLTLKAEESRQWLGALNDLRLAIGTRLEVTDDDDGSELYALPDTDPRKPMVMAYLWLGGLQETLVETLLA